jgi:hypothetical protein
LRAALHLDLFEQPAHHRKLLKRPGIVSRRLGGSGWGVGALEVVMRALARAGVTARIDLRLSGESLEFVHHHLLIIARPEAR